MTPTVFIIGSITGTRPVSFTWCRNGAVPEF